MSKFKFRTWFNRQYVYSTEAAFVFEGDDIYYIDSYGDRYDVEADDVEQFTNCYDANGEEIYDGDWVKLGDSYGRTYKPTKVFWSYDMACWAVRWENNVVEGLGAACDYPQKLYLVKGKSS